MTTKITEKIFEFQLNKAWAILEEVKDSITSPKNKEQISTILILINDLDWSKEE